MKNKYRLLLRYFAIGLLLADYFVPCLIAPEEKIGIGILLTNLPIGVLAAIHVILFQMRWPILILLGLTVAFHAFFSKIRVFNLYELGIVLLVPIISSFFGMIVVHDAIGLESNPYKINWILTVSNMILCLNVSLFLRGRGNQKNKKISEMSFYYAIILACLTNIIFPYMIGY